MLTCKDFLKELSEFLDETTDPATRKELQAHISECPNCWVVMDTTKKTLKVVRGVEATEVPQDVSSKLMGALEKRMAAKRAAAQTRAEAAK